MPCSSGPSDKDILQDRLDRATRLLCAATKILTLEQVKEIPDMLAWMAEHEEVDRQRIAREEAARELQDKAQTDHQKRLALILSLTPEQRRLLGI